MNVISTHALLEPTRRKLMAGHTFIAPERGEVWGIDTLQRKMPDAQVLITFLSDRVPEDVQSHLPELRLIANYAVGYNNLPVKSCLEKGIWVCHTPDVLTDATADLTWALILGAARHLAPGDRLMRQGGFEGWGLDLFLGKELRGQVLGIVGMGRIGQAVARRADGFGMHVVYAHPREIPELKDSCWEHLSLDALLARADVLSLHCPLTASNRGLIGRRELDLRPQDALVINTARGPLLDEAALAAHLRSGHLLGAGLDVYDREPLVHPDLLGLPNVLLAPHTGSATTRARLAMGEMLLNAIDDASTGSHPCWLIPEWQKRIRA